MKVKIHKILPTEAEHGAICVQCDKCPDGTQWARRCRAEWLQRRMGRGLDLFVAYAKKRPVGFAEGEPMDMAGWQVRDLYWLHCMFVDPHFRGRGVGQQLLHAVEEDAAHRSRGLYAKDRVGDLDLASLLGRQNYHRYDADGQPLYGKLFRGGPEPIRATPKSPTKNRPQPDDRTVLVEHYWHASCAREGFDCYLLRRACTAFGSRVRLHSVCQDEPAFVEKYGSPPGYVFVDGVQPPQLSKAGMEDPDAAKQVVRQALRAKRLL